MQSALKDEAIGGFSFDDGGRTYTCSVEALQAGRAEPWWWFRVSPGTYGRQLSLRERQWLPDEPVNRPVVQTEPEDRHRYAPFRAAATDTQRSVEMRVVAYYDDLLARRNQPASHSWRQGPRMPRVGIVR
jgi:hypothetical protein